MGLIRFLYHNKSFILLCFFIYLLFWLTIGVFKQSTDSPNPPSLNRFKFQSNSTFHYILIHLFELKIKLYLIDPYVLDYLFIRRLSFEKLDKQIITFGISNSSIQLLFQYFQEQKFEIKISKSHSIDHIFIEYKQKILHLAILHRYYSYYLIEKNSLSYFDDIQLSYGDTLRAIEQ